MNLFSKKTKPIPQSYQPVLESKEVIDLFSRTTMHQQAALMRLSSRNIAIEIAGETHMGFEFDYGVEGAVIVMRETEPQGELQLEA